MSSYRIFLSGVFHLIKCSLNTGYVCYHKWYLLLFGFVFIVFQSHAGACPRVCPDSWRPQIRLRCSSVATCLVFETRSPIGLELTREAMLTVERAQEPACLHFPPPWLSLLCVFWGSTRGLDYHSNLLFFFHLSFLRMNSTLLCKYATSSFTHSSSDRYLGYLFILTAAGHATLKIEVHVSVCLTHSFLLCTYTKAESLNHVEFLCSEEPEYCFS